MTEEPHQPSQDDPLEALPVSSFPLSSAPSETSEASVAGAPTDAPAVASVGASMGDPAGEETALLYELVGDPHILTMVVLIGASALLPVPFLDDVVKGYLERRLVRALAEKEKLTLTSQEVERLTLEPPAGCCAVGCLGKAFIYPFRKLLRKILFFLEIKRSVDQSSQALARGWLLRLAMRRGLWSSGRPPEEADRLRTVIEAACHSHGVKPLETALARTFRGAWDLMRDFAGRFRGKLEDDKAQLEAEVARLEVEQGERLAGLSKKLKEALAGPGQGYLQGFAQEFERQLEVSQSSPPAA
jgi:hypothetical protein